jgi:hypothetical protein
MQSHSDQSQEMKLIILSVLLTGCATVDRFVCTGTGTCARLDNPTYQTPLTSTALNPTTATTVVTNGSTYVIVPNYSGGAYPSAIIKIGK